MGKSLSTYSEAADLLMERFPSLGLMAGTWSETEPVDEQIPEFEIEKAEALYFYGLGTGKAYFQCKEWLEKSPVNQLIFLEDDAGIIASFLHHPNAVEVLSHPQVHLELFSKKGEEIEALAQKFPLKRVEVTGLKSKKGLKNLKLNLLRKTALSHALYLDRLHGYQPFKNFVANIRHLPGSFYANGLKGAFKDIPAIVCGAGPSLQKSMDVIRGLENKALIIAGGSTLAALSSQGISPHFGMAIDPNLEEYRRLKNSFAFETPLLYSTRVHPSIFQTCNGPFGYMRSGIGGVTELWMEEELGLLDPLIGDLLPTETISVTAICIAWAQFLGCNPILIDGVDMAYTGNKRYASGVAEDEEVAFKAIDAEKSAADRILKRKDRNGNPVFTAVRWIMESAGISKFAKSCPDVRFVNTTEGGIGFKGIDYVPINEAVADFQERDIWSLVHEKIGQNPMPEDSNEKIAEKMGELKESLARLIEYLQILSGEKRGSTALAEMELKEESAYLYLFYDIAQVLKAGPHFWKEWLDLALKYQQTIQWLR
jgi:hypothetical protein